MCSIFQALHVGEDREENSSNEQSSKVGSKIFCREKKQPKFTRMKRKVSAQFHPQKDKRCSDDVYCWKRVISRTERPRRMASIQDPIRVRNTSVRQFNHLCEIQGFLEKLFCGSESNSNFTFPYFGLQILSCKVESDIHGTTVNFTHAPVVEVDT